MMCGSEGPKYCGSHSGMKSVLATRREGGGGGRGWRERQRERRRIGRGREGLIAKCIVTAVATHCVVLQYELDGVELDQLSDTAEAHGEVVEQLQGLIGDDRTVSPTLEVGDSEPAKARDRGGWSQEMK